MNAIVLHLGGDGWASGLAVDVERLISLDNDAPIHIGALERGTEAGKPSVAFLFKLPDGRHVLAETTLALLLTATDSLKARFGDPR